MMPKVTIAMSVYNVAPYVRAALDCIVGQTLHDLEILCIDDASTDGTWEILNEYAAHDGRIRLFRQPKNQGLSVSRNKAMELAQGEYLIMVDGDDLFAPDMAQKALDAATKTGADMVMWDYCTFDNESELPARSRQPSDLSGVDCTDKVALLRRPGFTPVRMTRLACLRKLHIQFPSGLTKQDIPVHWQLVTQLDKIALLPERLLFYRQQPGSTTNRRGRSLMDLATVMDITGQWLHDNGLYETYRDEFLRRRLSTLQGMYDGIKPELKEEALTMVRERLDDDALSYLASKRCQLGSRTRNFYGMLAGNPWATVKYRSVLAVRAIYRKFSLQRCTK